MIAADSGTIVAAERWSNLPSAVGLLAALGACGPGSLDEQLREALAPLDYGTSPDPQRVALGRAQRRAERPPGGSMRHCIAMSRRVGARAWGAVLVGALVLAACNFDAVGQGSTLPNLGDDTGDGDPTTMHPSETGADTTQSGGDDPVSSTDTSAGTSTTSDSGSTTQSATGEESTTMVEGCVDDPDCPAHWVCVAPDCVNPDEGDSCGTAMDCGPAAPFCAPDGACHDGSFSDSCQDGECVAPLVCGPSNTCHAGNEGDACNDASDCSTMAPLCFTGNCQDGSEGDDCNSPADCGPGAPHCPYDMNCHDGGGGDPCTSSTQCDNACVLLVCV
jgi:hypothetical protein